MKTLIPLKDKIKELCSTTIVGGRRSRPAWILAEILKEIKFIDQKPELWMFVPCDKDGNVLEEVWKTGYIDYDNPPPDDYMLEELMEYQKAKDRVLFKGCSAKKPYQNANYFEVRCNGQLIWVTWNTSKTLEDLTHLGLELTDKAF